MKMKTLLFIFIGASVCAASFLQAGVFVKTAPPQKAPDTVIWDNKKRVTKAINNYNKENENKENEVELEFKETKGPSHMTLAIVTNDELSLMKAEEDYPGIVDELKNIFDRHKSSIDIASEFQEAKIGSWQGPAKTWMPGVYYWVTLKFDTSLSLLELANEISGFLKNRYDIEQKFPFNAHYTLGTLRAKDGSPIDNLADILPENPVGVDKVKKFAVNKAMLESSSKPAADNRKTFTF